MTAPTAKWPSEKVSTFDAARRQLGVAITIWFQDGDTVSVYTLSHAAYEVLHNLTSERTKGNLIWDSPLIREEYRKAINDRLRAPANFFKHYKRRKRGKFDNPVIEFFPAVSELFMIFSVHALALSNIDPNDVERAFHMWFVLHEPTWFDHESRKPLGDGIPVEALRYFARLNKREFLKSFLSARRRSRL